MVECFVISELICWLLGPSWIWVVDDVINSTSVNVFSTSSAATSSPFVQFFSFGSKFNWNRHELIVLI
jgi:hypothetical protein